MRPVKIEFQAFGPYAGYEQVDFEAVSSKGLFLICGRTGTGKTMILDAITFALYGKSSGHGRDDFEAMRCTKAEFDKPTFVRFTFENHGEYYIFERRLERKRKNLSPEYHALKRDGDGVFQPLFENPKEKALNEKAVEIIGLEYDQFRQVIVLPQGQFEKLLTSNSDEKEKILTNIFGEEKWQAIAEKMYEEAAGRKELFKDRKERIANSLREEQCDSLPQLLLVIQQKKKLLKEGDEAYQKAGYDRILQEQQDLLALAGRFGDLHKAEERAAMLSAQKPERDSWEARLHEAARAEKVRTLITDVEAAGLALEKRKAEAAAAAQEAEAAQAEAVKAMSCFRTHLEQEEQIEESKKRRIRYEGKRSDYCEIDRVQKDLKEKQKEEKAAEEKEAGERETYLACGPAILQLRKEYEALNQAHGELLEGYLAGITGYLAADLAPGSPCPVCGSTTHPHKASSSGSSITKQQVDAKKKEADSKYQKLRDTLTAQEQAKKRYDLAHALTEKIRVEAAGLEAKLAGMKKNLAEGISSLTDLNKALSALDEEIGAYTRKKAALEEAEKAAEKLFTEAKAKIGPAEKEKQAAEVLCKQAESALEKGLSENQFSSLEEARGLLLESSKTEELTKKIADYDAGFRTAKESLTALREELKDRPEPKEETCKRILDETAKAMTAAAEKRGILQTELTRLTAKAKNLEAEGEGIEEKIREAEEDFAFAKKLRGDSGTGIQRYVLGIMFSSVVAAANQMLEMVHGGRYRLYRSDEKAQGTNKRGLELKVFDKNSEDHEGRFVSTLSGGEKFLASLALSIGMSTVAQKSGIRIEALFIDEGFGSLDEDSIDDAMNVLAGIQKANGLVGIISHVELLQDRIPTKLKVEEDSTGSHIIQTIG